MSYYIVIYIGWVGEPDYILWSFIPLLVPLSRWDNMMLYNMASMMLDHMETQSRKWDLCKVRHAILVIRWFLDQCFNIIFSSDTSSLRDDVISYMMHRHFLVFAQPIEHFWEHIRKHSREHFIEHPVSREHPWENCQLCNSYQEIRVVQD